MCNVPSSKPGRTRGFALHSFRVRPPWACPFSVLSCFHQLLCAVRIGRKRHVQKQSAFASRVFTSTLCVVEDLLDARNVRLVRHWVDGRAQASSVTVCYLRGVVKETSCMVSIWRFTWPKQSLLQAESRRKNWVAGESGRRGGVRDPTLPSLGNKTNAIHGKRSYPQVSTADVLVMPASALDLLQSHAQGILQLTWPNDTLLQYFSLTKTWQHAYFSSILRCSLCLASTVFFSWRHHFDLSFVTLGSLSPR